MLLRSSLDRASLVLARTCASFTPSAGSTLSPSSRDFYIVNSCASSALGSARHFATRKKSAKSPVPSTPVISVSIGFAARCHPDKLKACLRDGKPCREGGEDSMFVSDSGLALGVADGVGYSRSGVDAGLYSRTLMENCKSIFEAENSHSTCPRSLLERAWESIRSSKEPISGSCTACVAVVDDREGAVRVANLGDSGFMLIRQFHTPQAQIVSRSSIQSHSFNHPFQLGSESKTAPTEAQLLDTKIQSGDLILLASDGLFNNLFDDFIVEFIAKKYRPPFLPADTPVALKHLANALVEEAQLAAMQNRDCPHSREADEYNLLLRPGELLDDVSVVLCKVN